MKKDVDREGLWKLIQGGALVRITAYGSQLTDTVDAVAGDRSRRVWGFDITAEVIRAGRYAATNAAIYEEIHPVMPSRDFVLRSVIKGPFSDGDELRISAIRDSAGVIGGAGWGSWA